MDSISVIFHGGEPLLGGLQHLDILTSIIRDTFQNSGIEVSLSLQSNGLLFEPEIGDLMLVRKVSIGISMDGPPQVNDVFRLDHQGNPVSNKLETKLNLITSMPYRKIFSGFLCVVNVNSNPLDVFRYLLSYDPPTIDFLLPDSNHDRRPAGKELDVETTPYADWLINIYDYWISSSTHTRIRLFESIIRLIFGAQSLVDSLGLTPVDTIVIESDGEIEALDVLKTSFRGATVLGYNVFDNSFDDLASDLTLLRISKSVKSVCQKCRDCSLLGICGGGYFPHRYSRRKDFDNPSVYCSDLTKIIYHIYDSISRELPPELLNTIVKV